MERSRPVSNNLLVNIPKCTRQYWEGQYDAFLKCARILRLGAKTGGLTKEQLTRLASSFEMQARRTAVNKLGKPRGDYNEA